MGDGVGGGESSPVVSLSERAAGKVLGFLEDEEVGSVALRAAVQAGGCAGFRCALFFDDRELPGDEVSVQHGVMVRVDGNSVPYLSGSTVGWSGGLSASGFMVENPNVSGGCACGESSTF